MKPKTVRLILYSLAGAFAVALVLCAGTGRGLFLGVAGAIGLAFACVFLLLWCCPECGRHLGRTWGGTHCPGCGEKLDL